MSLRFGHGAQERDELHLLPLSESSVKDDRTTDSSSAGMRSSSLVLLSVSLRRARSRFRSAQRARRRTGVLLETIQARARPRRVRQVVEATNESHSIVPPSSPTDIVAATCTPNFRGRLGIHGLLLGWTGFAVLSIGVMDGSAPFASVLPELGGRPMLPRPVCGLQAALAAAVRVLTLPPIQVTSDRAFEWPGSPSSSGVSRLGSPPGMGEPPRLEATP